MGKRGENKIGLPGNPHRFKILQDKFKLRLIGTDAKADIALVAGRN